MVLRGIRRRLTEDPLLKVGLLAMTLALALAGVVALYVFTEEPRQAIAAKSSGESTLGPLVRSDPDTEPWVERDLRSPETSLEPGSQSEDSRSGQSSSGNAKDRSRQTLPLDEDDYPLPTDEQIRAANQSRHYHLPPGAIMSLSVRSIGLNNVPVLNSVTTRALDKGVVHLPDTSFPWSETPERNVYLAGHRLGWPGTGSHLVFYRLNELDGGERITLRDRRGTRYDYKVIESFAVGAEDSWVTGRVRGRDLLTLQTCTPIPTFHKRLIVRAERI
jgi:sortase A